MTEAGTVGAARRTPPEVQLGFVWGGAAAGALLLLALPVPLLSRMAAGLPPCAFRWLTSLPCPGCGTTRAVLALSRLELASAFALNPLATLGATGFLAGGVLALGAALAGRGVTAPPWPAGALRAGAILAVALSWAWLVLDGR